MWLKSIWMEHPLKTELTREGLLFSVEKPLPHPRYLLSIFVKVPTKTAQNIKDDKKQKNKKKQKKNQKTNKQTNTESNRDQV